MKIGQVVFLTCIFTLQLVSLSFAQRAPYRSGEVIIMLRPGVEIEEVLAPQSIERRKVVPRLLATISPRMNIHVLGIPEEFDERQLLKVLRQDERIALAQMNHILESRSATALIPDDPFWNQQWNMENLGQQVGVEDADIDATDAWEITTGGVSAHGDEIVLAIVDEGFDLQHEDINWWENLGEIEGNNVDDDNNGYVDDRVGWNAFNNTGDIPELLHGTHVAGIVGAVGNNEMGVAGVDWGAKVLAVAGASANEATVVAAYTYIYELRRLYNESQGQQGAFVVASNSSFGLDRVFPDEFPIWCAMFDSLGQQGILSVVATSNGNNNVDQSGDIPSNCTSDFVIAVTATDREDEKPSGGFGSTSIDLGAPGRGIYSTIPNNNYGLQSGTSMAAPHVTGTLGLMYAAACPNLMARYKNDPAGTALLMKSLLLDNVDPIEALNGITTTGGRLNAFQSLEEVLTFCEILPSCGIPFGFRTTSLTDVSATIQWNEVADANEYTFRYRVRGTDTWTTLSLTTNQQALTDLSGCTEYEVQVETRCSDENSGFSTSFVFQTEGCCEPPVGVEVIDIAADRAQLRWESVFGALNYVLQYRIQGTEAWEEIQQADTVLILEGLDSCTVYEYQLKTLCPDQQGEFSRTFEFRTLACGFCADTEYCEAVGEDTFQEWIEAVEIEGVFSNVSGNNDGYGAFTEPEVEVVAGIPYILTLTPGFRGNSFDEYWSVWIDLDQNGRFDDPEERLVRSATAASDPLVDTLILPTNILSGSTRMRVIMQFEDPIPGPCANVRFGEVEDYCLNLIVDPNLCLPPTSINVEVLSETSVEVRTDEALNADSLIFAVSVVEDTTPSPIPTYYVVSTDADSWNLVDLQGCVNYQVSVAALCEGDTSFYSFPVAFTTPGCGACKDLAYCQSQASSATSEWIAQVQVGAYTFDSESDQGYGDFTGNMIPLAQGEKYLLNLSPGFSGAAFAEYWKVWVDWNQNGEFTAGELVFDSNSGQQEPVSDTLFVPENAQLGSTRMRVSMQFMEAPDACTSFQFGEVEDYCVEIQTSTPRAPVIGKEQMNIFPNPATTEIQITYPSSVEVLTIIDMFGRLKEVRKVRGAGTENIRIELLPVGVYQVVWKGKWGSYSQRFIKK